MSRVLIARELGGGVGHFRRIVPIARELRAMGHEVALAFRDLAPLGGAQLEGLEWFQAPWLVPPKHPDGSPLNASDILLNVGFGDAAGLGQALRAWVAAMRLWKFDVVVADAAPAALLAAGELGLRRIGLGSAFSMPALADPMPPLRTWAQAPEAMLRERDARLTGAVREAFRTARLERPAPQRAAELFATDANLACTWPQLDPFGPREGIEYLGVARADDEPGTPPPWLQATRPRVMACLDPRDPRFRAMVEAIGRFAGEARVAAPGLDAAQASAMGTGRMQVTGMPLDPGALLADADLAIGNGDADFTSRALAAGVPMALLPLHLEQYLIAQRLAALGAGDVLPAEGAPHGDLSGWLARIAGSAVHRDAARAAARELPPPVSAAVRIAQIASG